MSDGEAEPESRGVVVVNQCVCHKGRNLISPVAVALVTPLIKGCLCRWLDFQQKTLLLFQVRQVSRVEMAPVGMDELK